MKKAASSREASKWETLNRDILELIFSKLNTRDLTKGASRVSISWFLASHRKTLWNTVDLDKFRIEEEEEEEEEGLSLWNILRKIIKFFSDNSEVTRSLTDITKFSRTTPKNLFFRFNSVIYEDDLMFIAVRMPNIEKLALPRWCYDKKDSFQFAFSKWKNLKTLIIAHDYHFKTIFEFQAVGENCSNLTNFKYLGYLDSYTAEDIVSYFKNLKRLSLRCSFVTTTTALLLIKGLQKLAILNMSHCINYAPDRDPLLIDYHHVQAAAKKLDNFIICTQDCSFCKEQRSFSSLFKRWRYDEIDELEF